jgi:hypothetical protein
MIFLTYLIYSLILKNFHALEISSSSCQELGYPDNINNADGDYDGGLGVEGVCGVQSVCSGLQNYLSSVQDCNALRARLCTRDEYEALDGGHKGCQYDSQFIWTSTSCGTGKHWAARLKRTKKLACDYS